MAQKKQTDKHRNISIDGKTSEALKEIAERNFRSVNSELRIAIASHIQKKGRIRTW